MHEALMILSNNQSQKVTADRVQHQDFKRIFQCPTCHAALTLRKSYTRDSNYVPATFVHPRDGAPCKERIEYNFSSTNEILPFELIRRGQNTKKLETAFLRCLKYFAIGTQYSNNIPSMLDIGRTYAAVMGKYYFSIADLMIFDSPFTEEWIITGSNFRKKIEYNQGNGEIHKNSKLLIEAVTTALSSRKLDIFFNQEINKVREFILSDSKKMNFFMHKKESDWWRSFYERVYSKNIDSLSLGNLLDEHIDHLKGLTRYLRQGVSSEAKKKFFEILILGGLDFPVPRDVVWTQVQKDDYERRIWGSLFTQAVDELIRVSGLEKKPGAFVYPDYILAQARHKARSSYECAFESVLSEHKSVISKERKKTMESFSLMSENFLEDILAHRNLSSAISDFDSGRKTVGGRFIKFFVSKQISLMKRYDWSVFPLFYEDIRFPY